MSSGYLKSANVFFVCVKTFDRIEIEIRDDNFLSDKDASIDDPPRSKVDLDSRSNPFD